MGALRRSIFAVTSSEYSTTCKCLKLQAFQQVLLPSLETKTLKNEIKISFKTSGTPFSSSSTRKILYNDVEFSVMRSRPSHHIGNFPSMEEKNTQCSYFVPSADPTRLVCSTVRFPRTLPYLLTF